MKIFFYLWARFLDEPPKKFLGTKQFFWIHTNNCFLRILLTSENPSSTFKFLIDMGRLGYMKITSFYDIISLKCNKGNRAKIECYQTPIIGIFSKLICKTFGKKIFSHSTTTNQMLWRESVLRSGIAK